MKRRWQGNWGLSARQVRRGVKELEDFKLIKVKRPKGVEHLRHKGNDYSFLWHSLFDGAKRLPLPKTGAADGSAS